MPKDKHLSENISYLCGKDFILMRKKELYDKVIAYFEQAMPVAETELNYGSSPFWNPFLFPYARLALKERFAL